MARGEFVKNKCVKNLCRELSIQNSETGEMEVWKLRIHDEFYTKLNNLVEEIIFKSIQSAIDAERATLVAEDLPLFDP